MVYNVYIINLALRGYIFCQVYVPFWLIKMEKINRGRLYYIYFGMKYRCENIKNKAYYLIKPINEKT